MMFHASLLGAQDVEALRITSEQIAPQSAEGEAYTKLVSSFRTDTRMTYADKISGDLSDRAAKTDPIRERSDRLRMDGTGAGLWVVILGVLAVLALWLKFGGAGVLLARKVDDIVETNDTAPESWKISSEEAARDPRSLLEQIAAMPNKTEAMVRLLRHCLLAAGDASDTRFARADTEREAFRRLPQSWTHHAILAHLLRDAELAHYGGRPVTDDMFAMALGAGELILNAAKPTKGARHA